MRFLLPLAIAGLFAAGNVWAGAPTVTADTSNLAANATTLTIAGTNFDPVASNNTVAFNNGATGTVTSATATSLTVTSLAGLTIGSLTAVVTNGNGNSGAAVQVATVVAASTPTVTMNTANLATTTPTIIINGTGFDPVATSNTITFDNGAVGSVTVANPTSLIVTFSVQPLAPGPLNAVVTTDGVSSGAPVQVATVVNPPTVTANTANLALNAPGIVINGSDFDPAPPGNTVVFDNGAAGVVLTATLNSLTITFTTPPAGTGSLTAIVNANGGTSGAAVQVATVVPASTPIVTANTANLASSATTLTINGTGFDTTPAYNTVTLSGGATGTITGATATSLTLTSVTGLTLGPLGAVVVTNGVSSGAPVQVATVVNPPTVTANTANLAINAPSMVINGTNFSATPANNTLFFNNGAAGTVTTASATSLTVTFTTQPASTGSLTAIVTTSGINSGAAVQVATVVNAPTVTADTANLLSSATTIVINGTNFSATPANNAVGFTNGAAGTVTGASATSLTVTFTTQPASAGSLTAVVTSNGGSSGAAVQVATIVVPPMVTASTANLATDAASIVINGTGFSTTPANNTVQFNSGATGTVTAATATSLTVTFGTKPTGTGSLTAVVNTNGNSSGAAVQVATLVAPAAPQGSSVIAVATGSGIAPQVNVYDARTGVLSYTLNPFTAGFTGGVNVAVGDVNGDGFCDIIAGAGAGASPHVQVYSGRDKSLLQSFFAFDAGFLGGITVAAGDVNGDGIADIVVGAGAGAPGGHVKVFSGNNLSLLYSFFAFDGFTGGVNVAAGDVNSDGLADIIVAAAASSQGHIKTFSGSNGSLLQSFFSFPGFTGGVTVAAGDVNADGIADIIVGAGAGAPGGHVKVFSGNSLAVLQSYFSFETGFSGGVGVAACDVNDDGVTDVLSGRGSNGDPTVKKFSGKDGSPLGSFLAFASTFMGGVRVAAGTPPKAITSSLAVTARVQQAFSYQATTNFGATIITFEDLPGGLTATQSGLLSGTPARGGVFQVPVSALGKDGQAVKKTLVLTVEGGIGSPAFLENELSATGPVNAPFRYSPDITGATPISVVVASGVLPPGLTMDNNGLITGTPTATGTYNASVKASNPQGSATVPLVIVIGPADGSPLIARSGGSAPTISVKVGTPVDFKVVAAGSNNTAQLVGNLPKGLSFDGESISGAPLVPGTFTVEILVFNAVTKKQDKVTLTITVTGKEGEEVTAVFNFTESLKQDFKDAELQSDGRYAFAVIAEIPEAVFTQASKFTLEIQRTVRGELGDTVDTAASIQMPFSIAADFNDGESALFVENAQDASGRETKVGTVKLRYSKGVLTVKGTRRGTTLLGGATTLTINNLLNEKLVPLSPPKDVKRSDYSAVVTLGPAGSEKQVVFDLAITGKKAKVGKDSADKPFARALALKGGQVKKTANAVLTIDDVSVAEGNTGEQVASFLVSLPAAATKEVTVDFATMQGTAVGGAAGGQSTDRLVRSVYTDLLREPTAEELPGLVAQFNTAGSLAAFVDKLLVSPDQSGGQIRRIYRAVIGTDPSADALQRYTKQLNDGVSLTSLAQSICILPAATQAHPFLTNPTSSNVSDFLSIVYKRLVGRTIDAAGLAYYTGQLNAGRPAGGILVDIATSNEAPSLPIADLYRQFLRREPTSAESLALETSAKAQANPENFIKKSLIISAEYANRLAPDFTTASGTLTFAKGDTSKTIEVKVTGDAAAEPDETFKVQLSNPVGATLGKETGTATIKNDD